MLKRYLLVFPSLVGLIAPAAFVLALLVAPPAHPQPLQPPGCERNLAVASTSVAVMQARMKNLGAKGGPDFCTVTRLYFLEVVKARAVAALCKTGAERERDLGRFDADVDHINEEIGTRCQLTEK